MKVLVIDNNTAFLNVFAKLLEIKGFDVTAETTLKVGLKHLESKSYPIVFVDAPLDNYTENQILTSLSKNHVFKNSNVFLFSSVEFNDVELVAGPQCLQCTQESLLRLCERHAMHGAGRVDNENHFSRHRRIGDQI